MQISLIPAMAPAAKVQLKGIFFSEDMVDDVNGYRAGLVWGEADSQA